MQIKGSVTAWRQKDMTLEVDIHKVKSVPPWKSQVLDTIKGWNLSSNVNQYVALYYLQASLTSRKNHIY